MSFNIMDHAVAETATLELNNASGQPLIGEDGKRASVTICGPGSQTYAQAEAEVNRVVRSKVAKANGNVTAAMEGSEERANDFLAAITVSFNNWDYPHPDGGKWKTARDMFKAAYAERSIGYIRKQVDEFHGEWGNFSAK